MRVNAQVSDGTLSGTVTNQGRLGIPYARVTLQNLGMGVARSVTTGAPGTYAFSGLAPGNYELTVEAAGFVTQVRTAITVTVGAKLAVNIAMKLGDPKQVNSEALAESQTSAASGGNVSASTVRD